METLDFAGIILLKKNDLVLNLLLNFLNINYSHIGFYYKNPQNGRYKVILINSVVIPEISVKEYDLETFINKESLTEIQYKKLIKFGTTGDHFKKCIYEVFDISVGTKMSKSELLISFFRRELPSFELFNRVIQKIERTIPKESDKNLRLYLLDSHFFSPLCTLSHTAEKSGSTQGITCNTNLINSIYKMFIDTTARNTDLIIEINQILNTFGTTGSFGDHESLEGSHFLFDNYLLSSYEISKDVL